MFIIYGSEEACAANCTSHGDPVFSAKASSTSCAWLACAPCLLRCKILFVDGRLCRISGFQAGKKSNVQLGWMKKGQPIKRKRITRSLYQNPIKAFPASLFGESGIWYWLGKQGFEKSLHFCIWRNICRSLIDGRAVSSSSSCRCCFASPRW